jgi:hypothetical protein
LTKHNLSINIDFASLKDALREVGLQLNNAKIEGLKLEKRRILRAGPQNSPDSPAMNRDLDGVSNPSAGRAEERWREEVKSRIESYFRSQ